MRWRLEKERGNFAVEIIIVHFIHCCPQCEYHSFQTCYTELILRNKYVRGPLIRHSL